MKGLPFWGKVIRAGAALTALVVVILWMANVFGDKIEPTALEESRPRAPAAAQTVTVRETILPVIEEAAGSVQAERRTAVSARIMAVIREVQVSAGDAVSAGDVLVVLDDRDLGSRVAETERTREAAAARRQKSAGDLDRARRLRADGVVSQSEFDEIESAFKIADAELERAEQAVEAARIALSYTRIASPVDGRVIDRLADPGDMAVPGRPLLSLYDPSALRIEVPVRESLVGRLRVGDEIAVRVGSRAGRLTGRVDEIVPQAEPGSRTFLVKIGLPKQEGLYTGMFARVLIPAGERRRLLVPADAIERIGQLRFAHVVGADRRLERRVVTLGAVMEDDQIEVLSGLRAGEKILATLPVGAPFHGAAAALKPSP